MILVPKVLLKSPYPACHSLWYVHKKTGQHNGQCHSGYRFTSACVTVNFS